MCKKLFAHIFIDFDVLLYSKGNRSKIEYSLLNEISFPRFLEQVDGKIWRVPLQRVKTGLY